MLQGQGIATCATHDDASIDIADGSGKVFVFGLIKAQVKYHIASSTKDSEDAAISSLYKSAPQASSVISSSIEDF
jgi:hypothetical protein